MWERRLWERKLRERRRVPWRPRQGQGLAEETWTESEAARGWRCRLPLFVRLGKAQDHPTFFFVVHWQEGNQHGIEDDEPRRDRKSTRLNSSHTVISYAVFCLKKKKKKRI